MAPVLHRRDAGAFQGVADEIAALYECHHCHGLGIVGVYEHHACALHPVKVPVIDLHYFIAKEAPVTTA